MRPHFLQSQFHLCYKNSEISHVERKGLYTRVFLMSLQHPLFLCSTDKKQEPRKKFLHKLQGKVVTASMKTFDAPVMFKSYE